MTFRRADEAKPVSNPKASIENSMPLTATPVVVVTPPVHTPKVDIRFWMPVN
jgi:hypothetical protein